MFKRLVSLLLTIALVLSFVPSTLYAVEDDPTGNTNTVSDPLSEIPEEQINGEQDNAYIVPEETPINTDDETETAADISLSADSDGPAEENSETNSTADTVPDEETTDTIEPEITDETSDDVTSAEEPSQEALSEETAVFENELNGAIDEQQYWATLDKTQTNIVIPDGITNIPTHAFNNNTTLESISLPNTIKVINSFAFSGCTNLKTIIIPSGVTRIENCAFGFNSDTLIFIPKTVEYLDYQAFSNSSVILVKEKGYTLPTLSGYGASYSGISISLSISSCQSQYWNTLDKNRSTISLYSGIDSIPDNAFSNSTDLNSIIIPDTVTSIGNNSFSNCTNLTDINIPSSITSIGYNAFKGCSNLFSISIPDSVATIGYGTFSGCSKLYSINIPQNVNTISDNLFSNCTSLKNIAIPDSITRIGSNSFANCVNLTDITIPSSVKSIAADAFTGCNTAVYYKPGFDDTLIGNSYGGNLEWIMLYEGNDETTFWNSLDKTQSVITIPEGITRIPDHAFENQTGLIHIDFPKTLKTIDAEAFKGCTGLTSITIPKGTIEIGYNAFEGCTGITSITFSNTLTTICSNSFSGCSCDAFYETGIKDSLVGQNYNGSITWIPFESGDFIFKTIEWNNSWGTISAKAVYENRLNESVSVRYSTDLTSEVTLSPTYSDKGIKTFTASFAGHIDTMDVEINSRSDDYWNEFDTTACDIVIPKGITYIPFIISYCTELNSVMIPNTVLDINGLAFHNCSSTAFYETGLNPNFVGQNYSGDLTWIPVASDDWIFTGFEWINDNGNYAAKAVFSNIYDSTEIVKYQAEVTEEILYEPTYSSDGKEEITAAFLNNTETKSFEITNLSDEFWNNLSINWDTEEIVIPDGITSIPDNAFSSCSLYLKRIILPITVTSIGDYAFQNLPALQDIELPDNLTHIGDYAFQNCIALKYLEIPGNLTYLGKGAFYGCSSLSGNSSNTSVFPFQQE